MSQRKGYNVTHMVFLPVGFRFLVKDILYTVYHRITESDILPNIFTSVLSIIPGSIKSIKRDILRLMLTVAQTVIG